MITFLYSSLLKSINTTGLPIQHGDLPVFTILHYFTPHFCGFALCFLYFLTATSSKVEKICTSYRVRRKRTNTYRGFQYLEVKVFDNKGLRCDFDTLSRENVSGLLFLFRFLALTAQKDLLTISFKGLTSTVVSVFKNAR